MKITIFIFLFSFFFTSTFSQKRIAIVGGGIAGVSAAHYIHQYDIDAQITIFEKEATLGGNAKTVEITTNKGSKCLIDIGPQYFTSGPWDDYIQFLDELIGMNKIPTEAMAGTLLVQRKNENNPLIVTPLDGKFRGEKLGKLIKLKKFNTEAYKIYKNPDVWKEQNIEQWVKTLDFTEQYKAEIIYPFLAASLGTNIEDIKKTSTVEIVSLFAFRKPKASNTFQIMQQGMGGLIQQIGEKLKQSGVIIETNTPVYSINKTEKGFEILYIKENTMLSQEFDFVVMAVHADIAKEILSRDTTFSEASNLLAQLPYFEAHIVLHQDTNYINVQKPAFLNIFTDKDNQLISSTMNLSMISQRLNGIYKSWMSEEDTEKIKIQGLFLHETTFYHPLITPEFVANVQKLHTVVNTIPGLCIIGGWSEGLETQNSAVVSGRRSLQSYKDFTF
jgi:predicted NAD/FAD-binding protein